MTFEEYKQMAEEFVSSDDYLFLAEFYKLNKNFQNLMYYFRYHPGAEPLQGYSRDELLTFMYEANILCRPLDRAFREVSVGDTVLTPSGIKSVVTAIRPTGKLVMTSTSNIKRVYHASRVIKL